MYAVWGNQPDHEGAENEEKGDNGQEMQRCVLPMNQKKEECVRDADFRLADLRDHTLDGMRFRCVDFSGADLSGTNLSECIFEQCWFEDADLSDACLACSTFDGCDFSGVRFSGTMITETLFSGCRFSGPSVFTLSWLQARIGFGNFWRASSGRILPFLRPVMMVRGIVPEGDLVVLGNEVIVPPDIVLQPRQAGNDRKEGCF